MPGSCRGNETSLSAFGTSLVLLSQALPSVRVVPFEDKDEPMRCAKLSGRTGSVLAQLKQCCNKSGQSQ